MSNSVLFLVYDYGFVMNNERQILGLLRPPKESPYSYTHFSSTTIPILALLQNLLNAKPFCHHSLNNTQTPNPTIQRVAYCFSHIQPHQYQIYTFSPTYKTNFSFFLSFSSLEMPMFSNFH